MFYGALYPLIQVIWRVKLLNIFSRNSPNVLWAKAAYFAEKTFQSGGGYRTHQAGRRVRKIFKSMYTAIKWNIDICAGGGQLFTRRGTEFHLAFSYVECFLYVGVLMWPGPAPGGTSISITAKRFPVSSPLIRMRYWPPAIESCSPWPAAVMVISDVSISIVG